MRIAFLATGDIALPCLEALLAQGQKPVVVVTQPDKPVGRQRKMTSPAIKIVAEREGIPVMQPEKIRDAQAEFASYDVDVAIVMAYGQILPKALLSLARVAFLNVHASLLPKYRGAACIQAAIAAGDEVSGVSIMHVVAQLDAGDVVLRKEISLAADETGGTLHDRLALLAVPALQEALVQIQDGTASREPQVEADVSYVGKLLREDGLLDFSRNALELERMIRAYSPWPGTYFEFLTTAGETKRLKVCPPVRILEAQEAQTFTLSGESLVVRCGQGSLVFESLQPEGGKWMSAGAYARGNPMC